MFQRHMLLLLTLCFGIVAACPLTAYAQDSGDDTLAEPSVLLFNIATGGYPPYTIVKSDGRVSGIMWDVMSALAKAHNLRLEAREIPTKRVEDFLLMGQLDVTMRSREWSQNPEKFLFSAGVVKVQDMVFTRADSPLVVEEVEDLKGTILLTQLGYRYPTLEPDFESGAITRLNVTDQRSMFQRLGSAERFDGLVSELRTGRWLIKTNGWEGQFEVESLVVDETDYRFMFAPHWADYIDGFNQTLKAMRASGELDAILAKY